MLTAPHKKNRITEANSNGLWYPMSWIVSGIQWTRESCRCWAAECTISRRIWENSDSANCDRGLAATISVGQVTFGSTLAGG